jgi:hypothetical protein
MKRISCILLTIIILGCNQKNSDLTSRPDSLDISKVPAEQDDARSTADSLDENYSDCIRGQASPITKENFFQNTSFKLDINNRIGKEKVLLKNGDELTILNWGCEYYVLTFRFETSRFDRDTSDIKYWMRKGIDFMKEIQPGINAPLDIENGTSALENYLEKESTYRLGEEIIYQDDIMRKLVSIHRIKKIGKEKIGLEITYSLGPL